MLLCSLCFQLIKRLIKHKKPVFSFFTGAANTLNGQKYWDRKPMPVKLPLHSFYADVNPRGVLEPCSYWLSRDLITFTHYAPSFVTRHGNLLPGVPGQQGTPRSDQPQTTAMVICKVCNASSWDLTSLRGPAHLYSLPSQVAHISLFKQAKC